jgi:hypothetical protein
VADGVGRVGGGDPLMGMDSGGDPLMGADGDGRRQQCKNLVATARNQSQKLNSTKVSLQASIAAEHLVLPLYISLWI